MIAPSPIIKSHDRLGFTVCMALAFHAVIILGVSFVPQPPPENTGLSRLEITLVQHRSDEKPEEADYIAQHNQLASGTEDQKRELTSTEQAEIFDTQVYKVTPQASNPASRPTDARQIPQLTSRQSQRKITTSLEQINELQATESNDYVYAERQQQIASLEAKLAQQQQILAKKPRIQRLTSIATKATPDAAYLYLWQTRVEELGNKYYPEEARKHQLYGSLRMLVSVNSNGTIGNVEILQSSGHPLLDDAAVGIVRLAEPFPPFGTELRKTTDVLEIIRTWHFAENRLSSSN